MTHPERRWLEVEARAAVPPDVGALLADALVAEGARGVEERGNVFVAWFEEPSDPDAFLAELPAQLERTTGFAGLTISSRWQDQADWAELWKQGLGSRRVTDRIIVHPSWVEPEDVRPGDIVLTIDPGMAFGTAEHGTTRGCLRLLDGLVRPGDRLLDIGSGSGILAIAAIGLGAVHVTAIEADELAVEALVENVDEAGMRDQIRVIHARVSSADAATYTEMDGIVANLEAGLLRPLFPGLATALGGAGWLMVSGILETEWELVRNEVTALGFALRATDFEGEWCSATFEAQAAVRSSA